MTRLALWMVASLCLVGCTTKPSEDECRQAISNMTRLMGTENLGDQQAVESQVRRCKGGSKKKSVQCAIKAQTLDDLRKCDFYKVPENAKGIGAADTAGSAAVGSGSAAAGSAAVGSAGADATGSAAVGSAGAGSADGSAAAGSAGAGSAAAGSAAAGSAMGSAAPSGPAKQ
jgi:hypothetical protein